MRHCISTLAFVTVLIFCCAQTSITLDNSFNQKYLYVKYNIDTIIERADSFTNYTGLDKNGRKTKSHSYCINGNLMNTTEFDTFENELKSSDYSCEQRGKITSQEISEYKNNKHIKSSNSEDCKIFDTSSETTYDEQGRQQEYRCFSFGHLSWKEIYSYEPTKRHVIKIRRKENGETIFKEIIKLDSLNREIISECYYDGKMTSKYTTEYDEYGNKKRYAGYFYPNKELILETISYYSTKFKLDSIISKHGDILNNYNLTCYEYNAIGLLINETYRDYANELNNWQKVYEYK